MSSPHEDQKYLDALHRGDARLISEIYKRFSRGVMQWVVQNNGRPADAQDIFQDALMAIYDRYCGRDFQLNCPFGALLLAICKRKWYDRLSQKKREEVVRIAEEARYNEDTDVPVLEAAEAALEQQGRQECLARVFTQLSEQCRQLLEMLAGGQKDMAVIVRETGLPNANAVYQSKHRCTTRWKQLFSEQCKV